MIPHLLSLGCCVCVSKFWRVRNLQFSKFLKYWPDGVEDCEFFGVDEVCIEVITNRSDAMPLIPSQCIHGKERTSGVPHKMDHLEGRKGFHERSHPSHTCSDGLDYLYFPSPTYLCQPSRLAAIFITPTQILGFLKYVLPVYVWKKKITCDFYNDSLVFEIKEWKYWKDDAYILHCWYIGMWTDVWLKYWVWTYCTVHRCILPVHRGVQEFCRHVASEKTQ